jgi:glucose-6-phosphate isomerase
MTNSRTARDWLLAAMKGDEYAIARHFVAVWTNAQEMPKFGIDTANMFGFWDWVGGRYSMDSAIGFSTMLAIGPRDTRAMLGGFDEMDEHFRSAPFERNLPVLMGLLAIWYNNLWRPNDRGAALRAISQALSGLFAATDHGEHGKHVTLDRAPRGLRYGPIYWGEPGTNGQHSFYQLMHLGTRDFIAFAHALNPLARHHDMLLANVFAQTETLAFGKTAEEVKAERTPGWLLPHQLFEGNRPSNALLLEALTPAALGTSQRVSLPSAPCASNTAFLRVATCLEPSINPQKAQQAW